MGFLIKRGRPQVRIFFQVSFTMFASVVYCVASCRAELCWVRETGVVGERCGEGEGGKVDSAAVLSVCNEV